MLKVGLTGGIGCGKSTAVNAFRELGVAVIDADKIAQDVLKPNSKGLFEVIESFGEEILLSNGELNRVKLKSIVFDDSESGVKALRQLERITHPKIKEKIKLQMKELINTVKHPYLLVDIPLLVEKNYQSLFDRIVVVDCSVKQQIDRVKSRDELEENTIIKIIEQQATREKRKKRATDILDNSKDIKHLLIQVEKLHKQFVRISSHQL